MFHSRINSDSPTTLKAKMNKLPISGVSDKRLREFHNAFIELMTMAEKAKPNDPPNPKAEALYNRMTALANELDEHYGGK